VAEHGLCARLRFTSLGLRDTMMFLFRTTCHRLPPCRYLMPLFAPPAGPGPAAGPGPGLLGRRPCRGLRVCVACRWRATTAPEADVAGTSTNAICGTKRESGAAGRALGPATAMDDNRMPRRGAVLPREQAAIQTLRLRISAALPEVRPTRCSV